MSDPRDDGPASDPETEPSATVPYRPGPVTVLAWAAWFGLAGGLLELAAFLARCLVFDPRNFNVSRHFPWMFPAAGLAVAAAPGLALALGAWLRPRRISPALAVGLVSFPAYLGVLFRAPLATAACLILAAGLALRTAGPLGRRARGFDRFARRSLVAAAVLLAATALVCRWLGPDGGRKAGAKAGGKNVLLIVLDTVRAESLGLYGYGRETAPNLARYAARGVRFDRAFSTAPWTAPSHASMFTGRWGHELSVGWGRPLDRTSPTLAEYLGRRGYDTAGFVANTTYCSYETGLNRGFDRYEDYDVTPGAVLLCSALVQRTLAFADKHPALASAFGGALPTLSQRKSAARINRDVLGWLSSRPAGRPFFAFLNYFDAHHPYLTPEPVAGFGGGPETVADERLLRGWWGLDKRRLTPRDVALARDSYDRCIAYLDRHVGALLDELDRTGVLDETLVVVTADHGEHLGEQHLFGHGTSLYRPEIHVPLIVLTPGDTTGRVVAEPVSLRDLPATVVDALGLAAGSPFPGRPLPTGATGPRPRDEPVLSEVEAPPEDDPNRGASPVCRGPMTSLVGWGFHYVLNGDGREELYDLEGDPRETNDLAAAPASAPALRRFRDLRRR